MALSGHAVRYHVFDIVARHKVPHALIACEENVVQGVCRIWKVPLLLPKLTPLQAAVTQPVRDKIFSKIFFKSFHIVTVEYWER